METSSILAILVTHYLADFVFQSHKMAVNKSSSNYWLGLHCAVYTLVLFLGMGIWAMLNDAWFGYLLIFVIGNGVLHFITDYYTSRLTSFLWARKEVHWFFVTVGFDQLIHYIILFLSFKNWLGNV